MKVVEESGLDVFLVFGFLVLLCLFYFSIDKYVQNKEMPSVSYIPQKKGIFYCPSCKTVFGQFHACCPEEESFGECVETKETPYKTWDEYKSGSWRP